MAYQIFKPISQVQGVLFDMDGVILDSEGLYTRFWQETALSLGYPMTHRHAGTEPGCGCGPTGRLFWPRR